MLLRSIQPKLDWNRLLPKIESKNLVAIMIVSNSAWKVLASSLTLSLTPFSVRDISTRLDMFRAWGKRVKVKVTV